MMGGDRMLQNNNSYVVRHIAKSSLSANKLRNRFIGMVIFLSAFLLSFSSTFGYNAAFDLKNQMQNMNIENNGALSETTIYIAIIAIIIFFACVLAVYNIFYISIIRRINEYGQLRAIGTTTQQIRKIVVLEGVILSVQYIPSGIIVGCLASYIISPANWYAGSSVVCALVSIGITFLTVVFSVIRPARIAASVSPIEAVKYADFSLGKRKSKRTTKSISPISLGITSLLSNKKKTVMTFLSLALSGVLFVVMASVMNAVNPVDRAKDAFPYGGEYIISFNGDLISPTAAFNNLQYDSPFSDELMTQVLQIDEIDSVEIHKYIRCTLAWDNNISAGITSIRTQDIEHLQKYLVSGTLHDTGIIINSGAAYYKMFGRNFEPGDTINLVIADGNNNIEMGFTVESVIHNKNDGAVLFLPSYIMDEIMTENCNTSFEIISHGGYSADAVANLKALIQNDERLSLEILKDEIAYFKSIFQTITAVLYAFVAFISIFALVNLINTVITNVLSRKKEIGIMQAIGLDNKQLRVMLYVEHSMVLLGSFFLSLLLGGFGGYVLCNAISNVGGLSFVQYQFPIWQITVYFAVIIIVQLMLTTFLNRSVNKQSAIERIYQH